MSTAPQPEYKSAQYEFTDEHNRTLNGLADSMSASATLLQLLGVVFATLSGLQILAVVQTRTGYVPAIGLVAGAIFCLTLGFWTSRASNSFRKIVTSRNEDVWHLMNALGKLHHMYAFMRFVILASLVLAAVGLALAVWGMFNRAA